MGEESNRTHDAFLSYSSKDKTWADAACAVLERYRVRCWIAPRDITPGDEWGASIIKGLNGSRIMVLIFSNHANASGQVRREVERAISQGMTVLPVRVEDVRPEGAMEYALGNRHWLDAFTPPVEQQLELIARAVQALLGREVESAAAPAPAKPAAVALAEAPERSRTKPCPYCGEQIQDVAKKCRFCGEMLDESLGTTRQTKGKASVGRKVLFGLLWWFGLYLGACFVTGMIIGLIVQAKNAGKEVNVTAEVARMSAETVARLGPYYLGGALILSVAGAGFGVLPGTRANEPN
jgi:hypothetical protein